MAAPAIESHPQKQRIVDAILAGDSIDTIAAWCDPPLHRTTIARYKRDRVAPALRKQGESAKVLRENELLRQTVQDSGVGQEIATATRQALAGDPIISRLNRKFERLDKRMVALAPDASVDEFVKLEDAECKAIDRYGKAMLHPGFVAQAAPTTDNRTQIVVVLPSAQAAPRAIEGEVIDVEAE
jgi:hypothetical protein